VHGDGRMLPDGGVREAVRRWFVQAGEWLPENCRTVELDKAAGLYYVYAGEAHLFAVPRAGKEPAGHRRHVLDLREGQVVFAPGGSEAQEEDVALLLGGAGETRIIRQSWAAFLELAARDATRDAAAAILCEWVEALSRGLSRPLPHDVVRMEAGEAHLLAERGGRCASTGPPLGGVFSRL